MFAAAGKIVLNSQSSRTAEGVFTAKKVTVYSQPGRMICGQVKAYLSQKQIQFYDRDITKDPSAILELRKLGFTVVDDKVIVGFDVPKLDDAL